MRVLCVTALLVSAAFQAVAPTVAHPVDHANDHPIDPPIDTRAEPVEPPPQKADPSALLPTVPPPKLGCLPSGNGFLRARIRGALNLDINWQNAELECEGGARPDGSGIRLSFAGPIQSDGRRLRMVFGVADAAEGNSGSALPTNLTVIFEGEKRLFATRGDDRCTVDKLSQERVGALGGATRSYRVIAQGFCIEPVAGLTGAERIVVSSFDFAGHVVFGTSPEPQPSPKQTSPAPKQPPPADTPSKTVHNPPSPPVAK